MTIVSLREFEYELDLKRESLRNLAARAPSFYRPFDILKPDGTYRHIDNPVGILKDVQRRVYARILRPHALPTNMVGGVAKRSVRDNALAHVGHQTLVKLDLRNHFGRIDNRQVFSALRAEMNMGTDLARLVTQLTTLHSRLPQGAPTSSALANLAILGAHREISELASARGLTYTIFVDDISISGNEPRDVIQPVVHILQKHGFAVTSKKLKIMDRTERQHTTGLVVNHSAAVPRSDREELRVDIMKLSALKTISIQTQMSIWGRIRYVAFINRNHGESLSELATAKLPPATDEPRVTPPKERMPCRHSRRHRYLGAQKREIL